MRAEDSPRQREARAAAVAASAAAAAAAAVVGTSVGAPMPSARRALAALATAARAAEALRVAAAERDAPHTVRELFRQEGVRLPEHLASLKLRYDALCAHLGDPPRAPHERAADGAGRAEPWTQPVEPPDGRYGEPLDRGASSRESRPAARLFHSSSSLH